MQQGLREAAQELRESPPGAVHASRPTPINGRLVLRVLAVGAGVATFLSLFGPFDQPLEKVAARIGQYFAYAWIGSLLGLASVRLAARLGFWNRGVILLGLVAGLIMAPAMALTVWLGATVTGGGPPPAAALPNVLWDTLLICVGASILAVLIGRGRHVAVTAPSDAPPKFLERLPLKLRGGELWAIEAEDHYLRLHTSKGQDLILLRLSDAIDELAGIEGAQAHRSWWVARDAIVEARRGDGRATLTLKDGSEVPVSRTFARVLRARGWF